MQNCSRSIDNYCFKHKDLASICQLQGGFVPLPPGQLLGTPPPDHHYRLELPRTPCVYY